MPQRRIPKAQLDTTLVDTTSAQTVSGKTITTSTINGVTPTTAGSATTYLDGTGAYSVPAGGGGGSSGINLSSQGFVYDDFYIPIGKSPFTASSVGTSAGTSISNYQYGAVTSQTGTTATGGTLISLAQNNIQTNITGTKSAVEARFLLTQLPNSTDNFQYFVGFSNTSIGNQDPTAVTVGGLYIVNGFTNFQLLRSIAGGTAMVDSGIAATAGTFYTARTVMTGNNTAANVNFDLYINGTLVATNTGTSGAALGAMSQLRKTAGTTSVSAVIDYFVVYGPTNGATR